MDGDYDDNFYFNNPVDYVAEPQRPLVPPPALARTTSASPPGTGAFEDSGPTYRFSEVLRRRGIPHTVDDWGPDGGHDWPYWKNQMNNYLARLPF